MPDELLDICDADDRVVGQAPRSVVHARGDLHRAVHCWVVRPGGELVLQMRSATKDKHPSTWTSSASGHVDAGEDYDTAIVRELREELGLRSEIGDLTPLARLPASEPLGREHTGLYLLRTDAALVPDPAEIADLEQRTLGDWLAAIERQPETFSPSVAHLLTEHGHLIGENA